MLIADPEFTAFQITGLQMLKKVLPVMVALLITQMETKHIAMPILSESDSDQHSR